MLQQRLRTTKLSRVVPVMQVDQVYFPQLEVVGDVGNAIWRISEAIKSKPASWDLRCDHFTHSGPSRRCAGRFFCCHVQQQTSSAGRLTACCVMTKSRVAWCGARRYFQYVREQMMATMEWQTKCDDFPLPPPRLVTLLRNAVPEKGIVCLDNGYVAVWRAQKAV